MIYSKTIRGTFCDRPNRFIAHVLIGGQLETVHVKNTGRCKELLISGADVALSVADDPKRKTRYDLISVYKPGLGWVNIDSQAPNRVVKEWLLEQDYSLVHPEHVYGKSRLDFYMERGTERFLMEVKGCTLAVGGVGYFPDAPTERGIRHLQELAAAIKQGYHCILAFVIQMEGIREVRPNVKTHPAFGEALLAARAAGVELWFLYCHVKADTLEIAGYEQLRDDMH